MSCKEEWMEERKVEELRCTVCVFKGFVNRYASLNDGDRF